MTDETFENQVYVLLPMPCCVGFDIPVEELEVIHADCTYNPKEDIASLGAYGVGLVNGLAGGIIGSPLACKSSNRLYKHRKTQNWRKSKFPKKPKKWKDSS